MQPEALNKLLERLNSSNLDDVKQNLRGFNYQNNEVPHVRKWIKEQKLKSQTIKYPAPHPSANKTKRIKKPINIPLKEIAIGVVTIVLAAMFLWILKHYLGLELK